MAKHNGKRNPLRIDPTRTTLLRRQFEREVRRRFNEISKAIMQFVFEDDAFGLRPGKDPFAANAKPTVNALAQTFHFVTKATKLKAFNLWLAKRIKDNVFAVNPLTGQPWTAKYIESAYRKGVVRAYTDANKQALARTPSFLEGSREQFLKSAFAAPERLDKVELLATRAFEDLKGISGPMAQRMNRIMADGLANGIGARKLARQLVKAVNISRGRAQTIARTELIHAHAEGQLDSFEDLGIEEVGLMAEWITAGDDRVCERCESRDGRIYTIAEARGQIPLHPNCRCAWIPVVKEDTADKLAKRKRRKAKAKRELKQVVS